MRIEQAGILRIELIENKDISINYPIISDNTQIDDITTSGEVYTIENCQKPVFEWSEELGNNLEMVYNYEISFNLYDFKPDTYDTFYNFSEKLNGWTAIVYQLNGENKYINACLFQDAEVEENTTNENYLKVIFRNRVPSVNPMLDYIVFVPDGSVTFDSTQTTFDQTDITWDQTTP